MGQETMAQDSWNTQSSGNAYPADHHGAPVPPPQYGTPPTYPPPPPMGAGATPVYVAYATPLGPHSQVMQCPHCHQHISTQVEYHEGVLTWLLAFLLFFFLCWICCFIPFCVDDCKDVCHKCPHCHHIIGEYKRI
uniref:LITAF domain-containing protein n=1 Tax=Panagrolaimus sp. PS1159 TaxID=55785 RepID=A0AC35G044_9BILA